MQEGFSIVDGFIEITENLADTTKFVANEPSAGLFYTQEHAQTATRNLINLGRNVAAKSLRTNLHTQDLHDSIGTARSMKECGLPIAEEMTNDIKKSLLIMSSKQPRRGGMVRNPGSGSPAGKTNSWKERDGYISRVIRSGCEKAGNIKWIGFESKDLAGTDEVEKVQPCVEAQSMVGSVDLLSLPESEAHELPLSSQVDEEEEKEGQVDFGLWSPVLFSGLEKGSYDEFKADKEVKLEEWLQWSSALGRRNTSLKDTEK